MVVRERIVRLRAFVANRGNVFEIRHGVSVLGLVAAQRASGWRTRPNSVGWIVPAPAGRQLRNCAARLMFLASRGARAFHPTIAKHQTPRAADPGAPGTTAPRPSTQVPRDRDDTRPFRPDTASHRAAVQREQGLRPRDHQRHRPVPAHDARRVGPVPRRRLPLPAHRHRALRRRRASSRTSTIPPSPARCRLAAAGRRGRLVVRGSGPVSGRCPLYRDGQPEARVARVHAPDRCGTRAFRDVQPADRAGEPLGAAARLAFDRLARADEPMRRSTAGCRRARRAGITRSSS